MYLFTQGRGGGGGGEPVIRLEGQYFKEGSKIPTVVFLVIFSMPNSIATKPACHPQKGSTNTK
jgi:hypothetical protein